MQCERIGICAASETQLSPIVPFNICNFATYSRDRLYNSSGGVSLLIKGSIQHNLKAVPVLQGIEAVGITLNLVRQGPPP
jgi:hypothetical protein